MWHKFWPWVAHIRHRIYSKREYWLYFAECLPEVLNLSENMLGRLKVRFETFNVYKTTWEEKKSICTHQAQKFFSSKKTIKSDPSKYLPGFKYNQIHFKGLIFMTVILHIPLDNQKNFEVCAYIWHIKISKLKKICHFFLDIFHIYGYFCDFYLIRYVPNVCKNTPKCFWYFLRLFVPLSSFMIIFWNVELFLSIFEIRKYLFQTGAKPLCLKSKKLKTSDEFQ